MQQRTWRWLRVRILGLLSAESSRLARHFAPPETKQKGGTRRGA